MKPVKLEDIEKKHPPFEVPEGYFEDLPMKIQQRVQKQEKRSVFQLPAFRLASSLAVVLIIATIVYVGQKTETNNDLLADVSEADLIAYLDLTRTDDFDVIEAFEQGQLEADISDLDNFSSVELENEALEDVINEYDLSEDFL